MSSVHPVGPSALPKRRDGVLCLDDRVANKNMQHGFRYFFNELSRRGVLKAGGIYLASAWVLLQVVELVLEPLGLPPWTFNLLFWLAVIGLPFTLVFTWRYDVTLDGISLTPPVEPVESTELKLSKGDFSGLAVVAITIGTVAFYLTDLLQQQQAEIIESSTPTVIIAENSIAVLPFENLGGDADQYLGMGLAEDILHRLVSIPELQVTSRTASFELDRTNMNMIEIGQRLGARNVLEGSVRREGDNVRIIAQLIDAQTGYHLWSSRYDRRIEDLFRIYDEISTALVTELQLTLAPETELIKPPPTVNMQAYDYFLQARSILQRASHADNVANAQTFFANAVEMDPNFAEAWAGQCRAYLVWHEFERAHEKIEAAEQSCRKALELKPGLAESHVALGDLYRIVGAYEQAVTQYMEAFQTSPELAIAWRGIGKAFDEMGREVEAEAALIKATEYDPDDLDSLFALGDFYMDRGRFAAAEPVFERMALDSRAGASAFNSVGYARGMLGDFEGAAEAFRQAIALEPTGLAYSNVGVMYYFAGNFEAAVIMQREAIALVPADAVNWSNLGDALRETSGGIADAQEAYRKCVEICDEMLAINASDAEMLTTLAHCASRLGDDTRAMGLITMILQDTPEDPYAQYYASLVHLEAGRTQKAVEAVTRAVELNFPVVQLRNDPQFSPLHGNDDYQALLAGSDERGGSD